MTTVDWYSLCSEWQRRAKAVNHDRVDWNQVYNEWPRIAGTEERPREYYRRLEVAAVNELRAASRERDEAAEERRYLDDLLEYFLQTGRDRFQL